MLNIEAETRFKAFSAARVVVLNEAVYGTKMVCIKKEII